MTSPPCLRWYSDVRRRAALSGERFARGGAPDAASRAWEPSLFGGLQQEARRALRLAQLLGVSVEPVDLVGADERAAARVARQLGPIDGRRDRAVLLMRLRRGDDAPTGHGDHAVAGGKILEASIDDAF